MMNRTMKTTYWKKFTLLWAGLLCLLLILCACDTSRTEEQSSALTDTEDCEGTAAETAAETRPLPDGDTAEEEKGSTVTVAQRVSSVKSCDLILVLEDGRIIGRGKHEDLLESCPEYREISDSQMGGVFLD